LQNLAGKVYYSAAMKITEEMRKQIRRELASKGGKARAAKYDKKTLTKWAKKGGKLGGRPRKDGTR
jgi:general stress protein YciG